MGIRVGSYSCAAALETTITSSEPEFQLPPLLDRVGTKSEKLQIDESNKTTRARQGPGKPRCWTKHPTQSVTC